MDNKPLFITGIGTEVGKTIVSAVLTEQLQADYWKPVQAGDLDHTDSDKVKKLISNSRSIFHPEAFKLSMAASPHRAAKNEGIEIRPQDFSLPETKNQLLIEGAGGLFVPLSYRFLMIDLIRLLGADAVLVVRNYLGCINHTLLSIHALLSKGIPLKHVVLNGDFDFDTLNVLLYHIPKDCTWSKLPEFTIINKESIADAPFQLNPIPITY
ncbi:dethiobiotin synthetase [Pedobacter cryoconitis]|uniref:ATP-dependent dethiobiotin synthetase BioD n=1 Tax=Pedobacter cryoconitis TaxID=188932 RepID=A0A7W9E088_9SPHI|nr:dethiobiotin synthase [Pedobacter cryoconitis]MBB5637806.1 dethiobiotin synthetase [Pedobacter cryoconitis]MBB6270438.1 dethiobiotin synthetase [Pedobacter cryoconitis]